MHLTSRHKGVTLVELLIVVVIVAILASVAVPSYRNYIRKGERQIGAACLMEASRRVQGFQQRRNSYPTSLLQLGYVVDAASEIRCSAAEGKKSAYTLQMIASTSGPTCSGSGIDRFQVQAVPDATSDQFKDGSLQLTQCFDGTSLRYRTQGDNQW